jgi:hypothetical protein
MLILQFLWADGLGRAKKPILSQFWGEMKPNEAGFREVEAIDQMILNHAIADIQVLCGIGFVRESASHFSRICALSA